MVLVLMTPPWASSCSWFKEYRVQRNMDNGCYNLGKVIEVTTVLTIEHKQENKTKISDQLEGLRRKCINIEIMVSL